MWPATWALWAEKCCANVPLTRKRVAYCHANGISLAEKRRSQSLQDLEQDLALKKKQHEWSSSGKWNAQMHKLGTECPLIRTEIMMFIWAAAAAAEAPLAVCMKFDWVPWDARRLAMHYCCHCTEAASNSSQLIDLHRSFVYHRWHLLCTVHFTAHCTAARNRAAAEQKHLEPKPKTSLQNNDKLPAFWLFDEQQASDSYKFWKILFINKSTQITAM